ncbi:cytochrome P450 [Saccharothrix sp. AJ9571]|nr:cytochrome P450 [Saccharothrix sp. AJ9571]
MTTTEAALFSPGYWNESLRIGDAVREATPACEVTLQNGLRVWIITRYHDARAALADSRLSKDVDGLLNLIERQLAALGLGTDMSVMFKPSMIFRNDPEHARLKRLAAAGFTRGRVESLRPRIERLTAETVAKLPRDRPIDLMDTVAVPLPLTVICELLGVPAGERTPLRGWVAAMNEDLQDVVVRASHELEVYFDTLIEQKRRKPEDDLLSALVHIGDDESDQLTHDELIGTIALLLNAGHDTTANTIGNGVRWLLKDDRDYWRLLGQQPELVPNAIEEVLRYDSPVRAATHRYTTTDVEVGGVQIPAGAIVLVLLQTANRDRRRFEDADRLDILRDTGGHLGFGHGIHYCLGAPLARMETQIVFTALTSTFPDARLVEASHETQRIPSAIMNGYTRLLVSLGG